MSPGSIEWFAHNGHAGLIENGKQLTFAEASVNALNLLRNDLEKHPGAVTALELMGISDPANQLEQYAMCMYGELNDTPDFINFHRNMGDAEFLQLICGEKDCPHRGILCHKIHALYGELTDRETEVCFWLSHDFTAEEIAEQMGISVNTVHVHIANIMPKIGCNSSKGIAAWAAIHLRNPKH